MKTYGVGVFGIGWVAGEHINAYARNPHMRVVALGSRQRKSAQAAKERLCLDCDIVDTYGVLLRRDDIDIIDVCSPNALHAEQAIAAAEAGKHVVIEKPIAMNLGELRAIRDAVAKAKVKSQVGFVARWNPHIQSIRSMIDKGSVLNEKFYTKSWFPGQQGWQHFTTTFLDSGDVAHHPFQGMMDDLAAALLEDKEATANIHEAYKSHEICLAIDRSIETGRAVKLPLAE